MRPTRTCHVLLAAVTATTSLATTTFTLRAQGTEAEHRFGGFVNAIWLERVPLLGGQPDAFRVWTAEDGSRIRVYDSVTDTITEEPVISASAQTLHDVYVDQYVTATAEDLFGVAVGTRGETVWWHSAGPTIWKPFPTGPAPGKELWACAVEHEAAGTTVWVAGQDLTLRHSTNKGSTWSDATWLVNPTAGAMFTSMDFADWALPGRNGIVGNDRGELFFTADGITWNKGTINGLPTPAAPLIFWDIDFRPGSTSEAFAVGGRTEGNGEGFAWRTTDGGQTWNRVYTNFEVTGIPSVPSLATKPGNPCSGVPGLVGGRNTHDHYATLYGCHALANGNAIFCAYAGQVWRYESGPGASFDILNSFLFTTGPLWGCHGDGNQEIWLSGQFGILRRSSNGSNSWQAKTPNEIWRLADVVFPTSDVGYVIGQSRRIARSGDGGVTWNEQLAFRSGPHVGQYLTAIDAYDQNSVVAIGSDFTGSNPIAYYTADGGTSCWVASTLPVAAHATAFAVRDVAAAQIDIVTLQPTFWTCGNSSSSFSGLMKSVDGGAVFTEVPLLGADYEWHGVATLGSSTVLVVGRRISTNAAAAWITFNAHATPPTWNNVSPVGVTGLLRAAELHGAAALAVGNGGGIFEYDPVQLRFVTAAGSSGVTTQDLYQVELAYSGPDLWAYAAGNDGVVARSRIGTTSWELRHGGTTDSVRGLTMRTSTTGELEAWITGVNGRWGDSTIVYLK